MSVVLQLALNLEMLVRSFVSAIVPSGTNLCLGLCTLAAFQDRCDHSPKCVDVRSGRPPSEMCSVFFEEA